MTRFLQDRMDATAGKFASPVRSKRLTVVLGRWLGAAFVICFATGLFSHLLQDPPAWMLYPTWPAGLYQLTQGVHVAAGIAAIPLLLAKLWSVFPLLLQWPPIKSWINALERASIGLFVAASLVEVATGLLNTYKWYPWTFPFRQTHYWLAWVVVGSLALHIAVKLPVITRHWRRNGTEGKPDERDNDKHSHDESPNDGRTEDKQPAGMGRRAFLSTVTVTTAFVVLSTAGQSFAWLAPLNIFAPRRQNTGPQGVPVNRTAMEAQVAQGDIGTDWTMSVTTKNGERTFSLPQLRALPQTEHVLTVACVEGWSQSALWRGVRIKDLLAEVGAPADSELEVVSMEKNGNYRVMTMPAPYTGNDKTLLVLELNGAPLDLDHGYPARIMAPGRPGVLQTKWVQRIEVL
ncbi:molybdopterin-dependent oxidoreductase [Arthrobacter sp. H35-D1]|uniref:molybdopterin-dependent oxidoreductase n=1 Tax=Arthrobacter sp. H35-D1 TaxID=3046202 RepID=UPI0024BAFF36|nr:molybdopterin-dependent oxidoreductase [Arthrobacter sp. H35-D1]MDJ0313610.1 molybdopterin-dependent oxidoreductase [Arthrobacter sp. H35-D1]